MLLCVPQITTEVVRFYEVESQLEAEQHYRERTPYVAVVQVTWLTQELVFLSSMQADGAFSRVAVVELARTLYSKGARVAVMERTGAVPYGQRVKDGPFKGLWYVDLGLVVGGSGGTY